MDSRWEAVIAQESLDPERRCGMKKELEISSDLKPIGDPFFACPECQNPISWFKERLE